MTHKTLNLIKHHVIKLCNAKKVGWETKLDVGLPGIGIYCPRLPLDDKKFLLFLSVNEVNESTIGSEKIVTVVTPTTRNTNDFNNIFHFGS